MALNSYPTLLSNTTGYSLLSATRGEKGNSTNKGTNYEIIKINKNTYTHTERELPRQCLSMYGVLLPISATA